MGKGNERRLAPWKAADIPIKLLNLHLLNSSHKSEEAAAAWTGVAQPGTRVWIWHNCWICTPLLVNSICRTAVPPSTHSWPRFASLLPPPNPCIGQTCLVWGQLPCCLPLHNKISRSACANQRVPLWLLQTCLKACLGHPWPHATNMCQPKGILGQHPQILLSTNL